MEQHPPSARIIGAGTIDSGGSVEAAVGIAAAPDTGRVYATISNNGGFGFSLDWVGFLGTEIPVGKGSQGVAASPDGTRLYVANSVDGTVSVLDTTGRTSSTTLVGTVPVGQGPLGIAVAPDSGHAYIANATDGTVSVIDANTLVANTFPVAVNPQGVAIAPSGKHVYVAHGAPTNALHVIDPANPGTGQISISTLDGTCAVSVTPDNRFVWVLCAPTGSATPACLLQIATEGPHKNEVVKKIDLSALGFVRVPEFVGVFVTPPINRQEIGVVARVEVNSPVVRGNSTTGRVHIEHALSRPTYVWLGVDPTTPASSVVVQERAAIPAGAKHADFDIGVALTQNPGEILIDAVAVFVKRAALKMEQ